MPGCLCPAFSVSKQLASLLHLLPRLCPSLSLFLVFHFFPCSYQCAIRQSYGPNSLSNTWHFKFHISVRNQCLLAPLTYSHVSNSIRLTIRWSQIYCFNKTACFYHHRITTLRIICDFFASLKLQGNIVVRWSEGA